MKLIDMVNIIESLAIMSKLSLSARDSFNLANIIITFENKVNLYNEEKNKLLSKYGSTENGLNYFIPNENKSIFFKELYELDNIDVDEFKIKLKVPFSKLDDLSSRIGGIESRHLCNVKDIIEFYDDIENIEK